MTGHKLSPQEFGMNQQDMIGKHDWPNMIGQNAIDKA
jgi:hypothetical protein